MKPILPMRKIILLVLPFCCLFFFHCKEDGQREVFNMFHTMDFTILAGSNTLDTHIFRFQPVPSNFAQQLQNHGLAAEDIQVVNPRSADLGSVFGDENLEFIHEISIQIFERHDPTIRRELFFLDPVPTNPGTLINPFPALPDVKQFVEEESFGIEVLLRYRFIPTTNIPMRLEFLLAARN